GARGLRMDLRTALEQAREQVPADAAVPLTARKAEIVRLVAAGLSNKEIAQRAAISERTVEAHLEQVRTQLGFNNRAQIAAWATARGADLRLTAGAAQQLAPPSEGRSPSVTLSVVAPPLRSAVIWTASPGLWSWSTPPR